MTASTHTPVLCNEAIAALAIRADGRYIDGTYGRGGHALRLLAELGQAGRLMVLDQDPQAISDAGERFADEPRITVRHANFRELAAQAASQGWTGQVDGILLDLGVSSPQLDAAERGFGFSRDGDLDMRMDTTRGASAAQWLARVGEAELAQVLREFGEERYARRIAAAIIAARDTAPITRTAQLAAIVKQAHPRWERHHHPATRSFQAIRIRINDELGALQQVLSEAAGVLALGGRLVVISFHSLEDRLVKRALRRSPPPADHPRHLPLPPTAEHRWKALGKPVRAAAEELADNPRARSAVLRVAERVA